jgi:hypothetical protein
MSESDVETVERVIPAPPEKIFELLVHPERHRDIDGSGSVKDPIEKPPRLELGAQFGMNMKIGLPYKMESTVVAFEEGRCVAWQSRPTGIGRRLGGGRIWRYDLEPVDGGTRVRESWDISEEAGASKWLIGLAGSRKRARESMTKTLERIEELTKA